MRFCITLLVNSILIWNFGNCLAIFSTKCWRKSAKFYQHLPNVGQFVVTCWRTLINLSIELGKIGQCLAIKTISSTSHVMREKKSHVPLIGSPVSANQDLALVSTHRAAHLRHVRSTEKLGGSVLGCINNKKRRTIYRSEVDEICRFVRSKIWISFTLRDKQISLRFVL